MSNEPAAPREDAEARLRDALHDLWEWQRGVQELPSDELADRVTTALAAQPMRTPHGWQRLAMQARDISIMLADAGVGSCTLVEGVRKLINRQPREDAEARLRQLVETWRHDVGYGGSRGHKPSGSKATVHEVNIAYRRLQEAWLNAADELEAALGPPSAATPPAEPQEQKGHPHE